MDDPPQKQCTNPDCRKWYPATPEFFQRDKQKKDGLSSRCNVCKRERNRAYYRRPEIKEYHKAYYQQPEVKEKSKAHYSQPEVRKRVIAQVKAYQSRPEVNERRLVYSREYYQRVKGQIKNRRQAYSKGYYSNPENRERAHAQAKSYRNRPEVKEHRRPKDRAKSANRRARKMAIPGSHTPEQSREQYDRQHGKCYWCQQKLTWGKHHEDHIIPLTRKGSSNDISNIVITHPHCNARRSNKLPHEAYEFGRLL